VWKFGIDFLKCESGATAIEYAFIASLISIVIVGGATAIGTSIDTTLTNVSNNF
jgi:pilus assembly protein Flp/PilA